MSIEVNEFIDNIDSWINSVVVDNKSDNEKVEYILNIETSELYQVEIKEFENLIYNLLGYMDSLYKIINKEKAILEYADKSIWYIIAPVFDSYGQDFTKGKVVNYNRAVRDNDMARELIKLRNSSEARLLNLETRIYVVKQKVEILQNILKRRFYEER